MKKRVLLFISVVAVACAGTALSLKHVIRLPAAPKIEAGKPIIACLGDSITFGTGVFLTRSSQSYPAYLQQRVGG